MWRFTHEAGQQRMAPAVSLAIAKRDGANAVVVSQAVERRLHLLQGRLIPQGVEATITRNYGETANEKANELLLHLGIATISIVLLIWFAVGRREAMVTAIVIPTTILLTLFASNLMGYTINRVSLFALIFSIGILVDDAIVIIENISRHWAMRDGRSRIDAAVAAVAEVGNPTIVATLDRCRGASADDVRVGIDGALHGADPGQCVGGDAVFLLRRRGAGAVADAEIGAQTGRGHSNRRSGAARGAC